MEPQQKKIISLVISGIIGAGKTTLLKWLGLRLVEEGYKVAIIREPAGTKTKAEILKLFYEDKKRWAYTFQADAFQSRIMAIRKSLEENPDADIFIMERSPWDDRIFMQMLYDGGCVNELEWNLYNSWASLWELLLPIRPDAFFYLKPSVQVCQERIRARGRAGEEKLADDYEYQRSLEEYHDRFFSSGNLGISSEVRRQKIDEAVKVPEEIEENAVLLGTLLVPCYRLQTNENFRDSPEVQERLFKIFMKIIQRHR